MGVDYEKQTHTENKQYSVIYPLKIATYMKSNMLCMLVS